MELISFIIIGLIAGYIASLIMRTNQEQGPIMDLVIGVIGAVVGGFIVELFGGAQVEGFNVYSILVAIAGAVGILFLKKQFVDKRM